MMEPTDTALVPKRSRGPSKKCKTHDFPANTITLTSDQAGRALGSVGSHSTEQQYPSPPAPPNQTLFRTNQSLDALEDPHSQSQTQPQPQAPSTVFTRASRTTPRQNAAKKRASTLSAARSEIDQMRGRLAEAEALVQRLEAENEIQGQNQPRKQNRRKEARGKKVGRVGAAAALGGGDDIGLGKRVDGGGRADRGIGGQVFSPPKGNAPEEAWSVFTPATYSR